MKRQALITACLIAALLLYAAGCGSSGSSDSTESNSEQASTEFGPAVVKSEGDVFATFGQVSSEEEREAASEVLEKNLHARAGHDWAEQCATLSAHEVKSLEERAEFITKKKGQSCAKALELEAGPAPKYVLAYTMTEPIAVLRVEGNKAYALYHGTHGKDYAMPMVKENGEWKVDHLVTFQLAKP